MIDHEATRNGKHPTQPVCLYPNSKVTLMNSIINAMHWCVHTGAPTLPVSHLGISHSRILGFGDVPNSRSRPKQASYLCSRMLYKDRAWYILMYMGCRRTRGKRKNRFERPICAAAFAAHREALSPFILENLLLITFQARGRSEWTLTDPAKTSTIIDFISQHSCVALNPKPAFLCRIS
jgi:hypothetical protein